MPRGKCSHGLLFFMLLYLYCSFYGLFADTFYIPNDGNEYPYFVILNAAHSLMFASQYLTFLLLQRTFWPVIKLNIYNFLFTYLAIPFLFLF